MMASARVQKELGVQANVNTLFQHGTVRKLAEWIDGEAKPAVERPLILLREGGEKTPLFLVHPPGGSVGPYVHLAKGFAPERAIYGLQAPGLEGEIEPLTTVEQMAEFYVEAIRRVQPNGPYCVAGWSAGGFIASEMAQCWREAGEHVGLLAMIDAPAKPMDSDHQEAFWEQAPLLFANLARDLLESLGAPLLIPVEELAQHSPTDQVERILAVYTEMGVSLPGELIQHARRLPMMLKITLEAGRNYQPRFYDGKVTLFCAADRGDDEDDNLLLQQWQEAAAEVESISVPGSHHSMVFDPAHAGWLAARMQECLRGVDQDAARESVTDANAAGHSASLSGENQETGE